MCLFGLDAVALYFDALWKTELRLISSYCVEAIPFLDLYSIWISNTTQIKNLKFGHSFSFGARKSHPWDIAIDVNRRARYK